MTPTYTYRLFTYTNGLDETVYRVKYRGFLGLYWWMESIYLCDEGPLQWSDRADALDAITVHANKRRAAIAKGDTAALRAKLNLVIVEDVIA